MILHTLNVSPSHPAFAQCLKIIEKGDALLLMGDGVYAAITDTKAWDAIQRKGVEIFLLSADARTAGINNPDGAVCVDMDGFVSLTERFPRQQAWY